MAVMTPRRERDSAVSADGDGAAAATADLRDQAFASRPRYGAYIVAAWLGAIVVSLLTYSGFYDIALRDFGLMLGALTLARLAAVYDAPRRLR